MRGITEYAGVLLTGAIALTGCTRPNPGFLDTSLADGSGTGDGTRGTAATTTGDGDATATAETGESSGPGETGETSETAGDGDGDGTGGTTSGDGDGDGATCPAPCGWNQHCDADLGECATAKRVIWLNFDGGVFAYDGTSDPATNTQAVLPGFDDAAPYDGADIGTIEVSVLEDFAQFLPSASIPMANGLIVTSERPPEGPYGMVLITPTNPFGDPNIIGSGELNCGGTSETTVFLTFLGVNDGLQSTPGRINFISSAVGRVMGLERVDGEQDLMHAYPQLDDRSFFDGCIPDYGMPPFECPDAHAMFCDPGKQNSVQEIRALVGHGP